MSELTRPRLVFLGLPRTGKSTYLGAFWALIQSPVETSVRESRFSGDRSYVQRLAEQVARGEELDRTALDSEEELAVEVTFGSDGLAELVIPDTSGEALRVLAERRVWYPRLLDACREATAVLMFVHPERVRLPERILVGAAGQADEADGEEVDFHVPEDSRFEAHRHACTAAELVDVFENLSDVWRDRRPLRVGVVVSAWDRVGGEPKPTPYEWMSAWLPAVVSTLEANHDIADFEVFGVSAQGGPLEARAELLALGEICDRVFAEDRHGRPISLVEPIRWAIWGS